MFQDALCRVRELSHLAVHGLSQQQLAFVPDAGANSIAWLIWHLTRVEDHDLLARLSGRQVWDPSWSVRLDLDHDPTGVGRNVEPADVARVGRVSAAALLEYHDAVSTRVCEEFRARSDAGWQEVIDETIDPPVTARVRAVSVVSDGLQHVGQAMYLRGLLLRREGRAFRW